VSTPLINAMVLAAGRGERMRPLTDHTPKPLLKVKGKPLLQWHLEALASAGFKTVVINVAYLGPKIEQFAGDGSQWGLDIRFSREPEGALETAGGIAQARPWQGAAKASPDTPFLVINADIWTDWPRREAFEIASAMQANNLLAHIVLVDNPPQHPKGDFEFDADGSPQPIAQPRNDDTVIARGVQRDAAARPTLTFAGIGIYRAALFSSIQSGERAPLAPLLRQAMTLKKCTASHYRGKWNDIGTPDRLEAINHSL
jgi:N-acetyl-alpha-D-muramate 1-phosphate uridylyltransferase